MTSTQRQTTSDLNPDLTHASRVLSQETIEVVTKAPFSLQGWRILERWAAYTPNKLLQLEQSQGTVGLASRLLEQQRMETSAMDAAGPTTHLSQLEIFQEAGLQPNL